MLLQVSLLMTPKTLETVLNCNLKRISDWLKANRLSLNIKKSKLILFQKKQSNFDNKSISIKLDGCKLEQTDNVKYLGVYIDKFVSWDFHITQLSNKLSRANGILCKLRHFTTKETLLSVYAIFYSHDLWLSSLVVNYYQRYRQYYNFTKKKVLTNFKFCTK